MTRRPTRLLRAMNGVIFIIGVGALIWMARSLGLDDITGLLYAVRAWAIPLAAISVLQLFLNSAAIHILMRPEQRMVSYWRVFCAQLSGQAVSSVTPTGAMGEIVKASLLIGHVPRYRAVSSVVAYNLCNAVASTAFLLFALLLCIVHGGFPARVEVIVAVMFAVLLLVCGALLFLVQRGFVRSVLSLVRKVRLLPEHRKKHLTERLRGLDEQLAVFRPERLRQYAPAFMLVAVSRVLGWFDLWVVLAALGHQHGFVFTVIAAAGGLIVGTLAGIVPLGAGADEGGQAGLFVLLGPGALVGFSVSLVRRIRTVLVASVGLLTMLMVAVYDRSRYRNARAQLAARHVNREPRS